MAGLLLRQFENEANLRLRIRARPHARSSMTSKGEKLDYWVTGFAYRQHAQKASRVFSGGERPDTTSIACEPADAPMLSSGSSRSAIPMDSG